MDSSSDRSQNDLVTRRNAALVGVGWKDCGNGLPSGPAGHGYAMRVSERLTTYFRETHRKGAMDITPRQVIDCLRAAGIKDWVLMGLHGYVGYLPDPRATQDVDVLVPYAEKDVAKAAIL
jgi:hypothetical protein